MISFCMALRMLHVDKSALQSCRRRNHFSQSSCGPRCGANANISRDPEEGKHRGRVPEVANSLAYTWISLFVSAARLGAAAPSFPLLFLRLFLRHRFHPRRFARLRLTTEAIQRGLLSRERERSECYDTQIVEIFLTEQLGFSFRNIKNLDNICAITLWTL